MALAELEGRGYGVTLGHLSETLRIAVPAAQVTLDRWVSSALPAPLQTRDDSLRFWALFVVELGYLADAPYD